MARLPDGREGFVPEGIALQQRIAELEEANERYRTVVENASEAICVIQGGALKFLNPFAVRLFGLEGREVGELPFSRLVHSDDRPQVSEFLARRLNGDGLCAGDSFRVLDSSENPRWVAINSVRIEWEGQPATLNFLSDITERKRLEDHLRASEEHYRTAIEQSNDGVAIVRGDRYVYVNQRFLDIFGYERPEEMVGKPISMIVHPDDRERVQEFNRRRQRGEPVPSRYEVKGIRENREPIYLEVSATRTMYRGESASLVCIRDVTERKWAEDAVRGSRDYYRTLFDEFPSMIWVVGTDARCEYVNRAWLAFTGRDREQEMGDGWLQVVHPEDAERCRSAFLDAFDAREPFDMEYRALRHDGQIRWLVDTGRPFHGLDGNFAGYVGSCYDITDRKQLEEELHLRATHDPLTGLPNRRLFTDRLAVAKAQAQRNGARLAVLMCDLDRFKDVNDTLGHDAGDELLAGVGLRILGLLRKGDTVARLGGDEFILLLTQFSSREDAHAAARRIMDSFREPFQVKERPLSITASLGIAVYPEHGEDPDTLVKHADVAMYKAKETGRNRMVFFAPEGSQSEM